VVRFLVASILIPFTSSNPERTIRVAGGRQTWQQLIDILGEIQGVKYSAQQIPFESAIEKEKEAFVAGDVNTQLAWSARPLAASGYCDYEPVDNKMFDFVPESPKETFAKMYSKK
jgi:hypothetical protein